MTETKPLQPNQHITILMYQYNHQCKQQSLTNQKQLIRQLIQQNLNQIYIDVVLKIPQHTKQRLSTISSCKNTKQIDIQSVSTMTGTIPSHKSDKKIDNNYKHQQIPIKIIQHNKNNPQPNQHSLQYPPISTHQQKQHKIWKLDKNGYLISTSLDITTIKYYFIKIASKYNMIVMRDLSDLLTIKTQKYDSIKCLFTMCLPIMTQRSVYQLQRYKSTKKSNTTTSTIKIICISGNQSKFQQFKKYFLYQLYKNNVLNLTNIEILNLLCFINRHILTKIIKNYQQAYNQYSIKNLASQEQLQIWQNNLMRNYKIGEEIIKEQIFVNKGNKCIYQDNTQNKDKDNKDKIKIQKNVINQIILQRILLHYVPICQFYLKLQMENNKQLLEIKKKITQTYTIKKVFQFLQIDSILLQEKYINGYEYLRQIPLQNLPYNQSIYFLNQLNISLSPLQNISKITLFGNKLRKSQQLMDMDNQLPLTIFCTLLSKNTQLKSIISFLKDYFQYQDQFEMQNRTLAALKAALEYIRTQWKLEEKKI